MTLSIMAMRAAALPGSSPAGNVQARFGEALTPPRPKRHHASTNFAYSISNVPIMSPSRVAAFAVASMTACLIGAPIALADDAPPSGVYGCYDARMAFSPVQGSHLEITPTPFAMFGLIDGVTYADWDGHHGHYAYEPGSGVLTMTDGSRQGWRYKKIADWSFSLIDNQSGGEIYTCPLDAQKNPSRGPW